jgi:hypothetical protein
MFICYIYNASIVNASTLSEAEDISLTSSDFTWSTLQAVPISTGSSDEEI